MVRGDDQVSVKPNLEWPILIELNDGRLFFGRGKTSLGCVAVDDYPIAQGGTMLARSLLQRPDGVTHRLRWPSSSCTRHTSFSWRCRSCCSTFASSGPRRCFDTSSMPLCFWSRATPPPSSSRHCSAASLATSTGCQGCPDFASVSSI